MVRFLFRFFGLVIFAASFILLIADGIRSLAADRLVITPFGETWYSAHPASINLVQAMVQRRAHPYVWEIIAQTLLLWPTFLVGAVAGMVLMLLGFRRRDRARRLRMS